MPLDAAPIATRTPTRTEATKIKLKRTLARLVVAARASSRRQGRLRAFLGAPQPRPASSAALINDARRAVLVAATLDLLAPASLHTAAYGTPREVVVPDEELASIFRAALAITAERRCTDRLVRIVVRAKAASEVRPEV
jgi:hypothetical protein